MKKYQLKNIKENQYHKYLLYGVIPYMLLWYGYLSLSEYIMFSIGFIPFIIVMYYIFIDLEFDNIELINLEGLL